MFHPRRSAVGPGVLARCRPVHPRPTGVGVSWDPKVRFLKKFPSIFSLSKNHRTELPLYFRFVDLLFYPDSLNRVQCQSLSVSNRGLDPQDCDTGFPLRLEFDEGRRYGEVRCGLVDGDTVKRQGTQVIYYYSTY